MAWLINLLKPIWTWLLSYGVEKAIAAIKLYFQQQAIKKDREASLKKALDEYQKAGTTPGLTPEQKAKEQEDAFKKYSDTLRNLH